MPTEGHGQRPCTPGPEEDDPTGIRDLLRGLPDPGPMPEDLVTRISARLSAEQDLRSAGVVDLATERSRRRPGRTVAYLGVAAAGLLLTTVAVGELAGGGLLGGTAGLDSAAQVSTRSGGSDSGGGAAEDRATVADGGGEDAAAQERDADGAASDQAASDGTAVPVELLPPLGEVTLDDYRTTALRAVDADAGESARSTVDGLDAPEADACWRVAGERQDWPRRHAAEAVLDGEEVVVLVGQDAADRGVALVLPVSCTTGAPVDALDTVTWGS